MPVSTLPAALAETVAVFGDAGTPRTTSEVADELDVGRRSTYDRLERLVDRGELDTKKVGASARVWWRPSPSTRVDGPGADADGTSSRADGALAGALDAVEEYAIFRLDPAGRVRTWNAGAERIKGYGAEEVLGENFATFYTDDDRAAGVPAENLARAAERGSFEDEGWRVRADGSRFWATVTITAVRDDDGDLQGYVKVTRDMTDRREHEQRLQAERDFTRQVLETAPASIFVLDADGEVTTANDRFRTQLGPGVMAGELSVGDLALYDESGDPIPSDERPYVTAFETGESVTDWRCQVELPSGDRRWISVNVAPLAVDGESGVRGEAADGDPVADGDPEADGDPVADGDSVGDDGIDRVVVAARDVTDLKATERELERQRDDLAQELREVFERVDDAFFALDDDWRFTHANEQAAALLETSVGGLLGRTIWEAFPGAVDSTFQSEYERALAEQESVSFEEYYSPLDAWFEVSAYPSESGLSVYFRDVTDRKERERELERYEAVVETTDDGVYVMDENGHFTMVNSAYAEMTGYSRADLVGSHGSKVVSEEAADRAAELQRDLATGARDTARLEAEMESADGERYVAEATFSLVDGGDGPPERVAVVRDVTERKERERELEQYRTVVETIDDGVYVVDDESRFLLVNEAHAELTGYDREELLGAHASLVTSDDDLALAEGRRDELDPDGDDVAVVETEIATASGERVPVESRFALFPLEDDRYGRVGVVRDVTERKEHERELERRVRQQEAVADLGYRALEDRDAGELMADAAELVSDVLGTDYCRVLDLDADAAELRLRRGVGRDEGTAGAAAVSAVEDDSQAARTLASEEPVVVEDLATESRFGGPDLLTSHDVRSGVSVVIGPHDDPWGILSTHDTDRRSFADHDVAFVQSVANVLASAIERHADERALVRQREQLAALDGLNRIARKVTHAVIDQSTREEIEETVCEHLAAAESSRFAWIGEVDVASDTVELRTEAGVEGYLDGITVSVDPDDERSRGPTGEALRTGEMHTTRDIVDSDDHDPWRTHVDQYDVRSSAAIPITHGDTTYGVLNVYADRCDAFEGQEGDVVGQLGEVVGHAIAAAERKRALLSDEVVELEFRVEDVFDTLGIDDGTDDAIALEHAVPVGDEDFLFFGRTTDEGVETVEKLVDAVPFYEGVTFRDDGTETTFELRVSDPPVLTVLAALGGSIEEAVIADGSYRLRVHLSPTVDVSRLVDAMTETYPEANLLKRRQLPARDDAVTDVHALAEALTDRQRAALEAAYHAGFFEWPRDADGETVADSLDIAPSTFHQHLRKAERKVFESLFAAPGVST